MPSPSITGNQQWAGLRCLWNTIKRFAAVIMMTLVGGFVGFTIGAAATFYCYFIGYLLGMPIGAGIGAYRGCKMEPRDATIIFVAAFAALIGTMYYGGAQGWDGFISFGAACLATCAATGIASLIVGYLPLTVRYRMAVCMAAAFLVVAVGSFLRAIYAR